MLSGPLELSPPDHLRLRGTVHVMHEVSPRHVRHVRHVRCTCQASICKERGQGLGSLQNVGSVGADCDQMESDGADHADHADQRCRELSRFSPRQ